MIIALAIAAGQKITVVITALFFVLFSPLLCVTDFWRPENLKSENDQTHFGRSWRSGGKDKKVTPNLVKVCQMNVYDIKF